MKELINYLSSELGIKNRELIEKDVHIHNLLVKFIKAIPNDFVFKGGTCLTKCYYGYYRFSEDLDFTYIHQEDFKNKSQKKIRRMLSLKINEIIGHYEIRGHPL